MIEMLNDRQEQETLATLSEDVPRQVLRLVAQLQAQGAPGAMTTLAAELRRWAPYLATTGTNRDSVSTRLRDCLDWFLAHGDIERGKGGRYSCPPPYLIGRSGVPGPDISADPVRFLLLGNPVQDALWAGRAAMYGGDYEAGLVFLKQEVEAGAETSVGWERTLILPVAAIEALGRQGLPVFDIATLRDRVPTWQDAHLPAALAPEAAPLETPHWGCWERYDPKREGNDRWTPSAAGPETTLGLTGNVLWRLVSAEDADRRDARVFLKIPSVTHLCEVTETQAVLWTFRLDHEAGKPRTIYEDAASHSLFVPCRALPVAADRWLRWEQRIATTTAQRPMSHWSHDYFRYVLADVTDLRTAAQALERCLRLRSEVGIPR